MARLVGFTADVRSERLDTLRVNEGARQRQINLATLGKFSLYL